MKDWKNIAALAGLILLFTAGCLLVIGLINRKRPTDSASWPNKDFKVQGKEAFSWKFELDKQIKYVFKGRPRALGVQPSLYDPDGWQFSLHGDRSDRALVTFIDTKTTIIQGEMLQDGVIRVAGYEDFARDDTEYFQLLLNVLLLLPRKDLVSGEKRTENVEFPCQAARRVHGKAEFTGEGNWKIEGCQNELQRILVQLELTVENSEKRDRITEFVAEGRIYWDSTRSVVAAGEWEYCNGLPEDRYLGSTWNYVNFTMEGQGFPPSDSDYTTLGMNVIWVFNEDITPEERVMRSYQKNARDQLNQIANAQEVFKSHALVDQDRDQKGEYGLLTEVTGAGMLIRTPDGSGPGPQPRPSIPIRDSYGRINANGFSTVDEYHFQVFLKTHDGMMTDRAPFPKGDPLNADIQEKDGSWCGFSWPVEYGKSGKAVYFTNGVGRLWESLDYVLDGSTKTPVPSSTDLPAEGTWKRVSITDQPPTNPYKLVMVRGKKIADEALPYIMEIHQYRPQLDSLAFGKALFEPHFLELEKAGRAFSKVRADGEFTVEEARAVSEEYGRIFRKVYMDSAANTLAQAQFNITEKKVPDPDGAIAASIARMKLETERLREKPVPFSDVVDVWDECNKILEQTVPPPGKG